MWRTRSSWEHFNFPVSTLCYVRKTTGTSRVEMFELDLLKTVENEMTDSGKFYSGPREIKIYAKMKSLRTVR